MSSHPCSIRRLHTGDEAAFLAALAQWPATPAFAFAAEYQPGMAFAEFVDLLAAQERGQRLPAGFVPQTMLFGFVDGQIVGRVSLRHTLTPYLEKVGGHIGYGVVPAYRRQGHARTLLGRALQEARTIGLAQVLLTCDDDNRGSIGTIEHWHGRLADTIRLDSPHGSSLKRRYWIDLQHASAKQI